MYGSVSRTRFHIISFLSLAEIDKLILSSKLDNLELEIKLIKYKEEEENGDETHNRVHMALW
jgi:hypothetical protein